MTVQKIQKVQFILISIDIQTFNSQPPQVRSPPRRCQSKTQHFFTSFQLRNHCFFPCIRILIVQKFQRKLFNFNFSRYSNSYFTKTTGFFFTIKLGIQNFLIVEKLSVENCRILWLASESWQFEISKKCSFYLFRSIFKLVFLIHYKFEFLYQELNLKHNTCGGVLGWQTVDSVHCIAILIGVFLELSNENCQKVILVLTHHGIQTYYSSTLPISSYFHQGVNLDSFIFEADCSYLKISKHDLYIGIGILIGLKWQTCF